MEREQTSDRMQSIGEILQTNLNRLAHGTSLSERIKEQSGISAKEIMQRRIDRYNSQPGTLNLLDGFNCKKCNNRGNTAYMRESNGNYFDCYPECECMEIRRSIARMKASGLENSIRQYTFDKFEVNSEWQQKMLDTAGIYVNRGAKEGRWLFVGGAVGSGKTHICTACAGRLLYKMPVKYMTWPGESAKLKAIVNDDEEYGREMRILKETALLYIDDFFKPVKDDYGIKPPTAADIRVAYEIINHRYINKMPTIISSERYLSELMDVDEATASRIAERSQGFCLTIGRDAKKNHRMIPEVLL